MTMIAAARPVAPERTLGRLTVETSTDRWSFHLDAAATLGGHNNSTVCVLSAIGDSTPIKALAAVLHGAAKTSAVFHMEAGDFHKWQKQFRYDDGYKCRTHRLGVGSYHLMAIAKLSGLLPVLNDEALYQELKSERFTTPLIRDFVPYISAEFRKSKLLVPLTCFQCEAGILRAADSDLDEVVESGVTFGHLQIA